MFIASGGSYAANCSSSTVLPRVIRTNNENVTQFIELDFKLCIHDKNELGLKNAPACKAGTNCTAASSAGVAVMVLEL